MIEKFLIVNSLLRDIPTATKQAAGRKRGPSGFIVHVSKSILNNVKRALKKFRLQLGFKYDATCTCNWSLCGYSLNDYEKRLENKAFSPHQGFN